MARSKDEMTPYDLGWFYHRLVNIVPPGGLWSPNAKAVYQVFHDAKLVKCISGPVEPKVQEAFEAVGWKVET